MAKDREHEPYEVGYGKPPASGRFKPGQSGNPKGRPKGSQNLGTLFDKVLNERVTVNENGRRRAVTKKELSLKQLITQAASGDHRAYTQYFQLLFQRNGPIEPTSNPDEALSQLDQEVLESILRRIRNSQSQAASAEIKPKDDESSNQGGE